MEYEFLNATHPQSQFTNDENKKKNPLSPAV